MCLCMMQEHIHVSGNLIYEIQFCMINGLAATFCSMPRLFLNTRYTDRAETFWKLMDVGLGNGSKMSH